MSKQAKKKLTCLPEKYRIAISEAIYFLALDPDDKRLKIKRLTGSNADYRLRVGNWRVLFNRDVSLNIIAVEKIGSREDIYK